MLIKDIMDSFTDADKGVPELFTKVLGGLAPEEELIRKELPARLLRFDEDDTAAVGVISSLRKDRDNEVLLPEGIDITNYSGIVLWQHDYWRDAIPHATNMWVAKDPPKGEPYRVVAKTQYLIELSELGNDVYRYRRDEHPLGQSVGFRSTESIRKGQTGYEEAFKAWLPRVKAMLKAENLKAAPGEFDEPSRIYTKWEMWEYSDVYIGSNVDALQIAVKSGIISNDEARLLVDFKTVDKPDEEDWRERLEKQLSDMGMEIEKINKIIAGAEAPPVKAFDFASAWDSSEKQGAAKQTIEKLGELWNEA